MRRRDETYNSQLEVRWVYVLAEKIQVVSLREYVGMESKDE